MRPSLILPYLLLGIGGGAPVEIPNATNRWERPSSLPPQPGRSNGVRPYTDTARIVAKRRRLEARRRREVAAGGWRSSKWTVQ